jgi:hypothetical protein
MKRILFIALALIMVFALAGCNMAPNVNGVPTDYNATNVPFSGAGASPGTNGNYAGGNYSGGDFNGGGIDGNNAWGNYAGGGNGTGGRTGANYGNNAGRFFGMGRGRPTIGNNRNGGNIGANGAYVFGGNAYGLR